MQVIRTSTHAEFFPRRGWMVWACWGLGLFDASLLVFLAHQVATR